MFTRLRDHYNPLEGYIGVPIFDETQKMNIYLPQYLNNYASYSSDRIELLYGEPRSFRNYYLIADKFMTNFHQNEKLFSDGYDKKFILDNSLYLIKELINVGVDGISFEFTADKSILFTSKLLGLTVYCEVYFDNENELNEIEVITNIYQGHNQIFTCTSDLALAVQQIHNAKEQVEKMSGAVIEYENLSDATATAETLSDYRSFQLAGF